MLIDACSSHGMGAVLLQNHGAEWNPVIYASRSLTAAEKNYAIINSYAVTPQNGERERGRNGKGGEG